MSQGKPNEALVWLCACFHRWSNAEGDDAAEHIHEAALKAWSAFGLGAEAQVWLVTVNEQTVLRVDWNEAICGDVPGLGPVRDTAGFDEPLWVSVYAGTYAGDFESQGGDLVQVFEWVSPSTDG